MEVGEVTDGSIEFRGERIHRKPPGDISRMGIIQVIEGRKVFEHLTVEENLEVASYLLNNKSMTKTDLERVYEYFSESLYICSESLYIFLRAYDIFSERVCIFF